MAKVRACRNNNSNTIRKLGIFRNGQSLVDGRKLEESGSLLFRKENRYLIELYNIMYTETKVGM